jgi:hypothetical protein
MRKHINKNWLLIILLQIYFFTVNFFIDNRSEYYLLFILFSYLNNHTFILHFKEEN